jgi:hypothetical protein
MVPGGTPVTVRQTTLQSPEITIVQGDVISTGTRRQLAEQVLCMAGLYSDRLME